MAEKHRDEDSLYRRENRAIEANSPTREPARTLEAATGHAIITITPDGRIDSWPAPASTLYNYTEAEMAGRHIRMLWASDEQYTHIGDLLAIARDRLVENEAWHERADGSVFWAATTINPILNEVLHGFTVVIQDITVCKQYERMLERQNDRLKEFTDILAHDLRNPLSVVVGQLSLYEQTGEQDHLDAIKETTDRVERLIDDLLRIARQGKVVSDPEPTDLTDVVAIAKRGTLPASASLSIVATPTVMADADRLCEMFENLLRNAVEHGGPDVTIRIGSLPDGFYVEDNGPGIPEEVRSYVFDHGFTTVEEGSGFGLSVVRTIVGAHGWDIVATEGAEGGARFEITGTEPVGV